MNNNLKNILIGTLFLSTLTLCTPSSNNKNLTKVLPSPNLIYNEKTAILDSTPKKRIWENVEEYDLFIRSKVNEFYSSDMQEMYDFYNIKRDIPKYGFKSRKEEFICLDCEGAEYIPESDSVYFYSNCSEELFNEYIEYLQQQNKNPLKEFENPIEELEKRIHHYIRHEGAHAFYYELGKELNAQYLFNRDDENSSKIKNMQYKLVEEGVAEYMAHKGELTDYINIYIDKDFREKIKDEEVDYVYDFGFLLVKPILDKNFKKGIEELIKNPLTKKDLHNLYSYREDILEKI